MLFQYPFPHMGGIRWNNWPGLKFNFFSLHRTIFQKLTASYILFRHQLSKNGPRTNSALKISEINKLKLKLYQIDTK